MEFFRAVDHWRPSLSHEVFIKAFAAAGVLLSDREELLPETPLAEQLDVRVSSLLDQYRRGGFLWLKWAEPASLPINSPSDSDAIGKALAEAWDCLSGGSDIRLEVDLPEGYYARPFIIWRNLSLAPGIVGIYLSDPQHFEPFQHVEPSFRIDADILSAVQEQSFFASLHPSRVATFSGGIQPAGDIVIATDGVLATGFICRLAIIFAKQWHPWYARWLKGLLPVFVADAVLVLPAPVGPELVAKVTQVVEEAGRTSLDLLAKRLLHSEGYYLIASPNAIEEPLFRPPGQRAKPRLRLEDSMDESALAGDEKGLLLESLPASRDLEGLMRGGKEEAPQPVAAAPPPAPEPTEPAELPRFLQGTVVEMGEDGGQTPSGPFIVGHRYQTTIRIGPHDESMLGGDVPFPEDQLPDREKNELTVFFSEPYHLPEVQRSTIVLPRRGASTSCSFVFPIREGIDVFEGRIIVAHRNRVLQTALLKGEVSTRCEETGREGPSLVIEAVVRPAMNGLTDRPTFDLAIIVNRGADGGARITRLSDDRAVISDIEERLSTSIRDIRNTLEGAIEAAQDDDRTAAMTSLLNSLALAGRTLYGAIVQDELDSGWLAKDPRKIQVVSAKPDSYLPLEFIYEKPVPAEGAQLCPRSKGCLSNRQPDACLIPDDCEESQYVCPLGFWGLTRVIERHAHDPSYKTQLGNSAFAMQSEPAGERAGIPVLDRYLYAPNDKVDAVEPGLSADFKSFLDHSVCHGGAMTTRWEEWTEQIKSAGHTLLILMPHTLSSGEPPSPTMEIGHDDLLIAQRIGARHVRPDRSYPPPIVALLGCATAVSHDIYMGFIPPMRRNGAALVLATLTKVLGRHVVPVARMLVEELRAVLEESKEPPTFADALLRVRRKALLEELPVALSLVAFGDADWRLTKGGIDVQN